MSELSLEEDPSPLDGGESERRYLWNACHFLRRQCEDTEFGVWSGVDVPPMDMTELIAWLSFGDETYNGPFARFCYRGVDTKKFRRFGHGDDPLRLRLKVVSNEDDSASITILLQQEYVGYDVFIKDGHVVVGTTGRKDKPLHGEEAEEVIDDIVYVASRMIERSYENASPSATLDLCDSQVPLATSKELASKPKRSFGKLALALFRT